MWTCEQLQRAYDQATPVQKQLIGGSTCAHWQAGYKDLSGWKKNKVDEFVREANEVAPSGPGGTTQQKKKSGFDWTAALDPNALIPLGVGAVFLWLALR
jgi:hypothetical protein